LKITKYNLTFILARAPILQKLLNIAAYPIFYLVRMFSRLGSNDGTSVVIISLHRLGDTVFTIPAVKEIIKHYTNNIYMICNDNSVPIYNEMFSNLSYVTMGEDNFRLGGRVAKGKARKLIKSLKPHTIIDLTRIGKSAFLIFTSQAREIIGSNREHYRGIYTHFTPIRKTPHLMDVHLDAVKAKFNIENETGIKIFHSNHDRNGKILIHPFGGWAAKEWELEKFILLAEKLSLEYSIEIIAPINSIGNKEKQEIEKSKISINETSSINELIEQTRDCSVFIGNDSGPLYIANMLGKPTFTIYGPTNPDYSIPFGDNHTFVNKTIDCSPEKNKQYCHTVAGLVGCPAFKCMETLKLDEVYNKLLPFVQEHCNSKSMSHSQS